MSNAHTSYDIAQVLGGIETLDAAQGLFKDRMDADHYARICRIQTPAILIKIANAIAMCDPEAIFVNSGTCPEFEMKNRYPAHLFLPNDPCKFSHESQCLRPAYLRY